MAAWPVDWRAIACDYAYLLVDKPYDPRRIEAQTSAVAENGSAAVANTAVVTSSGPRPNTRIIAVMSATTSIT